jgi:23S rRNA A1618 N6-methylase RlmF
VTSVDVTNMGDLTINFADELRIRIFPAGTTGEFWRVFEQNDVTKECVCGGIDGRIHYEAK